MENYTKEQQKEIALRVKEAHEYLKAHGLTLACQIVKERLDVPGKDVFGDRLYPYLQDLKYDVPSPIQIRDL